MKLKTPLSIILKTKSGSYPATVRAVTLFSLNEVDELAVFLDDIASNPAAILGFPLRISLTEAWRMDRPAFLDHLTKLASTHLEAEEEAYKNRQATAEAARSKRAQAQVAFESVLNHLGLEVKSDGGAICT